MSTNRVLEQLNAWREDLINLNRNNRLLYFRRTKSSTLGIEQPTAGDLLRRLSGSRGVSVWEPSDEDGSETSSEDAGEAGPVSTLFEDERPKFSARYESPRSSSRKRRSVAPPRDEIVCDVKNRDHLLKALRWLERRAAQEFMDKGLWILYLGVGILDWIEQPPDTGEQEEVSSPVVLIPVVLRRESAQTPFQLYRAEEDAAVNPALAFKLQHDFGITLPSFEDEDEEDIDPFLDSVREAIADQENWNLRDAIVLSVFSFHKEVMYRDLQNNEVAVAAHPIVQSLALGHRADRGLSFEPTQEHELDDAHPPESMISILDCDASQAQCLVAAARGHSFVMEGPPGTGKSQTIANMIADALGHTKTVLFVSEKAAALEVVQNRLESAGLSEFILELHSHKATRKQVAQTLGRSLTTRLAPRDRMPEVELQRLIGHRRELSGYARAMNEPRQPLGKSVHQIVGELARLQHLPQPPANEGINGTLTAVTLARIYEAAEALARSWGPVERGDEFLWRSLVDGTLTQGRRASLLATLERALSVVEELDSGTKTIASETGLSWKTGIPDTRRFEKLLALLNVRRSIPSTWLSVQSLNPVNARRDVLAQASQTLKHIVSQLETDAGPQWPELNGADSNPLEQNRVEFEKGSLGFLTGRLSGWQQAKSTVTSLRSMSSLVRRGAAAAPMLAESLDAPEPQTIQELRSLVELGLCVFSPHKPAASWLDPTKIPEIRNAVDVLEPRVNNFRTGLSAVEALFNPSILDIDVDALQLRFDQVHRGFGKLLPAHWRDRRVVREHAKSGKVRQEELKGLRTAAECKRYRQVLAAGEGRYAALIGSEHYQSVDTDFGSLRASLAVADRIVTLAGPNIRQETLAQRFSAQATEGKSVVRSVSGLENWVEEFAVASAALGSGFEALACRAPLADLAAECDMAAAQVEQVTRILGDVARNSRCDDISFDSALRRLRARSDVSEIERQFTQDDRFDRELLGSSYDGPRTDFQALADDLHWAEDIRQLSGRPMSQDVAMRVLELQVDQYSEITTLLAEWTQIESSILNEFQETHRSDVAAEFETPFEDVKLLLDGFANSVDDISEWGRYAGAQSALLELGMQPAVNFCIQKRIPAVDVSAALRRSALESWVDSVRKDDPRLRTFESRDRDHVAEAFRQLDKRLIQVAAAKVIEACNAKRPTLGAGAAGLIAAEANKQKRHMPIRRLVEQAAPVVQALKPCMMMSPLSVSQFLPSSMRFDLVIFDEASQVKPADAINCVYRGRQLIIAGDQKQLPPTPFFDRLDTDSGDEWEEEQLDDYESVLDVAKGSGLRSMGLRWHYRSQHEDLITYSNYSFYDGRLVTFPSSNTQAPDVGIELFVTPGVYRRGGARDNPIEAAKVVERVLFHLRQHSNLSIGVVAFSEAQANTIENEILRRASECPELRVMLEGDRLHGGFVKNLESVQGDERDVIIFSIGYGRDEAGRFTLNFGPLNKSGGHRRLNVAITRARRRVEVVSSIEASDFVGELRSDGVRHLRRYLEFASRTDNRLAALSIDLGVDARDSESPFEEEVARVVRSWGYEVVPQVGCADYRIDLAVKDPGRPGRYALGIECDGAMYHSSRVARDRDRLRQEVLVRLGWTNLHRIWGLSWYWNRGQEEIRLRKAIERAIEGRPSILQSTAAEPVGPEELTIELGEIPEWVVPYRVVVPNRPRTNAAMHEGAAQTDLQRMIVEVVSGEGPVATELVLRRVRERWGMNRAGSRARSAFDSAIRALRRRGEIVSESDGFLMTPGQTAVGVRGGDKDDPETIRSISEIPPSELKEAIVRFVDEVHAISEDELSARVAGVFGWSRRGSDIASELRRAIRKLVTTGVLVRTGETLTVRDEAEGV